MIEDGREAKWASLIADAMANLAVSYMGGETETMGFVLELAEIDEALYDPKNIRRLDLRAAWNFADHFVFRAQHSEPDMGGLSWGVATQLLMEAAACLRAGELITDPRVLAFA